MENEIILTDDIFPADILVQYPDLFICIDYMMLKEGETDGRKNSMERIADILHNKYPKMPTTRQGLYLWVERWRLDGTMKKAEELYLAPKAEEFRAAVARVITAMPDMLDSLVEDVLQNRARPKTKMEITQFLLQVVAPTMGQQQEPGAIEKLYAQKNRNFQPIEITEE